MYYMDMVSVLAHCCNPSFPKWYDKAEAEFEIVSDKNVLAHAKLTPVLCRDNSIWQALANPLIIVSRSLLGCFSVISRLLLGNC